MILNSNSNYSSDVIIAAFCLYLTVVKSPSIRTISFLAYTNVFLLICLLTTIPFFWCI